MSLDESPSYLVVLKPLRSTGNSKNHLNRNVFILFDSDSWRRGYSPCKLTLPGQLDPTRLGKRTARK